MSLTEHHKKQIDAPTHVLFSPNTASRNLEASIFFVPAIPHEGHVKGSIYIGKLYKSYPQLAKISGMPIEKAERIIRRDYHPTHLTASLSHEELHRALMKLGETKAFYDIDRLWFGKIGARQPSGMPSEAYMKLPEREIRRRLRA